MGRYAYEVITLKDMKQFWYNVSNKVVMYRLLVILYGLRRLTLEMMINHFAANCSFATSITVGISCCGFLFLNLYMQGVQQKGGQWYHGLTWTL